MFAVKKWYLKACPRCGGDVHVDREDEAAAAIAITARCLQCGFEKIVLQYAASYVDKSQSTSVKAPQAAYSVTPARGAVQSQR